MSLFAVCVVFFPGHGADFFALLKQNLDIQVCAHLIKSKSLMVKHRLLLWSHFKIAFVALIFLRNMALNFHVVCC